MRILKRLPAALAALALATVASVGTVAVDRATASTPAPVTQEKPADHPELAPEEDEPGWDCRFDGNKLCGVFFEGIWQVISYDAEGNPVSVNPR